MKNLCRCGCKESVSKPENMYIHGHNRKGSHHCKKAKIKISESRKGASTSGMFGKQHTIKTRRKMSLSHEGKKFSIKTRRKISKIQKGKKLSKETKKKISKANKGKILSKEHIRRMCKSHRKNWQNPKFKIRILSAMMAGCENRPTNPERILKNRLNHLFPNEYKYVGDGKFWVVGKNPDFININGQKKIIEMFGSYWHGEERTKRTKRHEEQIRIRHFAKYGFKTLIVWQHELKNIEQLRRKLIKFHKERRF